MGMQSGDWQCWCMGWNQGCTLPCCPAFSWVSASCAVRCHALPYYILVNPACLSSAAPPELGGSL